MKKLISALCFMFALSPFAYAQDKAKTDDKKAAPAAEKKAAPAAEKPKKEPTAKQKAQQERMKACNDKATEKKGDERKKFMSSCLKGEDAGASDSVRPVSFGKSKAEFGRR
ncbi:MAG: PsiF family protein [Betaproteobacteria bacterium]|nr:PsiF family protein [Betaproteobacteria bacterium]